MKKTIWIALAVMAIMFFSSSVEEVKAQPPCGVVVDNTTLHADCEGPLVVAADSVHVNLAGHTITCNGDITRDGIEIINRMRVRVNNGMVESCRIGIFISGGGEHKLEHLQVNNHSNRGIEVASSEGTRLTNIETIGNGNGSVLSYGVLLRTSENYVSALTSRDNDIGLGISQDNNVVTSSEITANRRIGIATGFSATGNTIQSNIVTLNGEEGIRIDLSNNVVRSNKVSNNVRSGIWIRGDDNLVQANHVLNNGVDGIRVGAAIPETLPSPIGNIIQANTARGNIRYDLADSPTGPCTLNTWKANRGDTMANGCEDGK